MRTQFVIASSEARQSRRLTDHSFANEIAELRSQ
jgi:hypothetical protein